MKILKLFPSLILGEVLSGISQEETFKYINYCKSLENEDDQINGKFSKNQKVLNNELFSSLSSTILDYSKKLLNSYNHVFEDLQISNSWVNILNKNERISTHFHSNSYVSGVYYLTNASPIYFESPLNDKWSFIERFTLHDDSKFKINPKPNLLLLFPSFLKHKVLPSDSDGRISIAFNIIPKGEFGEPTQKLYL